MRDKQTIIRCPKPCESKIITRFLEGVLIHCKHYDASKNRNVKHEIFIPYEKLTPSTDELNLPSIETYNSQLS